MHVAECLWPAAAPTLSSNRKSMALDDTASFDAQCEVEFTNVQRTLRYLSQEQRLLANAVASTEGGEVAI